MNTPKTMTKKPALNAARTYGKKPETGVSKHAYNRFFLTTAYAGGLKVKW